MSKVDPSKGFLVKYLRGYDEAYTWSDLWMIRADADAFCVSHRDHTTLRGVRPTAWTAPSEQWDEREEPWETLRGVYFASSKATRANLPALAIFGVLGLAARREPGTLLAVAYDDGDVFFSLTASSLEVRTTFTRFVEEHPHLAGKITMDGEPLGDSGSGSNAGNVAQQIKDLGELRNLGLLTDLEFAAKKVELLARL
jgi:hypothetical protein